MKETSAELTTKVRNWLLAQGYPLEMRVAKAAERGGLAANLGAYYYDHERKVHREIDVWATVDSATTGMRFDVTFECKSGISGSKPWVVLTAGEMAHPGSMVAQRYVTSNLKEWWRSHARRFPRKNHKPGS